VSTTDCHLDAALHTVWVLGMWRMVTVHLSPDEREAAAKAVERHRDTHPDAPAAAPGQVLRWWAPGATPPVIMDTPPHWTPPPWMHGNSGPGAQRTRQYANSGAAW
jgi:hypothetical protein